jgi:CBS domain-containing protein
VRQRQPGGKEVVLCSLAPGSCLFQRPRPDGDSHNKPDCSQPEAVCVDWQTVELGPLPAEDVRHYMTSDPVVASVDESIQTVARYMLDAGVHRVIVVDEHGRPVGVVSSTDLIAALVNAQRIS